MITLVPPPAEPLGAPFEWPLVEAILGTPLPADYKAFCDAYGHGTLHSGHLLTAMTPGAAFAHDDLLGTHWPDLLADWGFDAYPFFPEPSGLLPFATGELKDFYWWQTVGAPDDWPALRQDDGGTFHRFPTATEALLAMVRECHDEDAVFYPDAAVRPILGRYEPFVVAGLDRVNATIELDLGGTFGFPRRERLEELLDGLDPAARAAIERAEAQRSRELLHLRDLDDHELVEAAVQAWGDRRAGYSG